MTRTKQNRDLVDRRRGVLVVISLLSFLLLSGANLGAQELVGPKGDSRHDPPDVGADPRAPSTSLTTETFPQQSPPPGDSSDSGEGARERTPSPSGPADFTSDPVFKKLGEKGELFAPSFLQEIRDRGDRAGEYSRILDLALAPSNVIRNAETLAVAETLVKTMGFLAKQPLEGSADRLISLLGVGPDGLRAAVRGALLDHIAAEALQGGVEPSATPTFELLGKRIMTNMPPPRDVLSEAASIIWELDGKALLRFLVEGLLINARADTDPPSRDLGGYILELRTRLRVDLHDVQGWEQWWKENQDRSLESILDGTRLTFDARRVEVWKKTFQRFRDSRNPELYLGALIDTFTPETSAEIRSLIMAEFAVFPTWIRETTFAAERLDEATRDKLLARGVDFLLKVLQEGDGFRYVSFDVKTSAVDALGFYELVVGRDPEIRRRVTAALEQHLAEATKPLRGEPVASTEEPPVWGRRDRSYALSLLRTAGRLRLGSPGLRNLLSGTFIDPATASMRVKNDPELIAEAVSSLGKSLSRQIDDDLVKSLLGVYRDAGAKEGKAWRDLRKRCVVALNLPLPEASPQRAELVQLFVEIVRAAGPEHAAERIPAINGLGILAKAGDETAREGLVAVLRGRGRFEASEVDSVVNALAYLGGEAALSCFLEFLVLPDQEFVERIRKKCVTVLEGGDAGLITWLFQGLERSQVGKDPIDAAGAIRAFCQIPALQDAFSFEKVDVEDPGRAAQFWSRSLARIRAYDELGDVERSRALLKELETFLLKNEKLQQTLKTARSDIADQRRRFQLRSDAEAAIKKSGASDVEVDKVQSLILAVATPTSASAVERWQGLWWIRRQILALKPSAVHHRIARGVCTGLSQPETSALWQGIAAAARGDYLRSIEDHALRLNVPAEPGKGS